MMPTQCARNLNIRVYWTFQLLNLLFRSFRSFSLRRDMAENPTDARKAGSY